MKVFISSVRRGLEAEREALPGLLLALRHEPKRFEDYTAQPVPPREACLRGVADAEAYVLVLGDQYGDPLPDSGLAPTEEEFQVARERGVPILVFVKRGGTPVPRQEAFINRVSRYVEGRFRRGFDDVAGLLTEVAAALVDLASAPARLIWAELDEPLDVPWLPSAQTSSSSSYNTDVETHVLPIGHTARLSALVLSELPTRLARAGRDGGLFGHERGLDLRSSDIEAVAATRREPPLLEAGILVRADRAVSVWEQLPSDMLGSILDEHDVAARVAKTLRLAADLDLANSDRVAVAVGLRLGNMVTLGRSDVLGTRSSATPLLAGRPGTIRVEPGESVATAAVGSASGEIATELARRLILRAQVSW